MPVTPVPCDCGGGTGAASCPSPVAFHFTTTSTGPVDHPGRMYDITLPINPGFAVQSMQVDSTTHAANIVWDVSDPDGEGFRQDLTTFMEGRLPAPAVVTITNPNVGNVVCGTAAPMQIHVECLRLDTNPPNLIELLYNGGRDMVVNPAYNENPPLNPPVSQGNYGFHLLARQDDPGPFPGNQPAGRVVCTDVANRGWETNDVGRTFEIWGQDQVNGQNVTPTPRGTPVQEITSDGPPPGGRSTIWQTFQAPATGNFIIRVVHGARDAGEQHRITLDNGDTNDAQNGDLIDDTSTPGVVTSSAGGPGPWTTFTQTLPLTAGNTYTLALSTNNPAGGARGGLFTDMRAYIDRPDLRATATTDDDACVVTVDETTTVCDDQYWAPHCTAGQIVSWENVETGTVLNNAAFWGQAPAPTPGNCPASAQAGGGGSVAANLVHTYTVCAVIGGVRQNVQRVVISDASGGVLADQFIGADGAPVTITDYEIGACPGSGPETLGAVCYLTNPDTGTRRGFQVLNPDGTHTLYNLNGEPVQGGTYTIVLCPELTQQAQVLCDAGNGNHQFLRWYVNSPVVGESETQWNFELDGSTPYNVVGPAGICDSPCDPVATTGVCLPDGTPLAVITARDCDTGTISTAGWINLTTGGFTAGAPPTGVMACGDSRSIQVSGTFCDVAANGDVLGLVLIEYQYDANGSISGVTLRNATTGAVYVPSGTVTTCPAGTAQPEQDIALLCDNNGPFIRDYRRDENGAVVGFSDYTLAGAGYAAAGQVGSCGGRDPELLILCDANGTRFLRKYVYDGGTGAFAGVVNTTLDGTTLFAPVGAVGICTTPTVTEFDVDQIVLCDANGTQFIRRFTFNTATGAVTATTNLTLAGAAFAPVGAVSLCSNCCPVEIGQGCYTGGSGRYTALRMPNGTISLIDSVSGAAVAAANIVQCQTDDTIITQSSEARLLAAGQSWTPGGDLVGTLTGLTFQVLTGTASLVDTSGTAVAGIPAGTSVSWNGEDNDILTGPQSITADAASTVLVSWTRR